MRTMKSNRIFLCILLLTATFNYADRALISFFAEPIKHELNLNDAQLGVLYGLGFALVYTIVGLLVGRWADRYNRVLILAVGVALWSVMTVLCGLAGSFVALVIARAGVGVGEAFFLPPVASLLAERFAPNRRASAMAIVQLGSPISLLVVAAATAWLGMSWGWRGVFWLFGGIGLLIAALVWALLDEPRKGRAAVASAEASKGRYWSELAALARQPAMLNVTFGGTLALLAMASIGQFLLPFFVRSHHLPLGQAGTVFAIVQFTAAMSGLLIGGFVADRLVQRDLRWQAWLPAIGLMVALVSYIAAFTLRSFAPVVVMTTLAGVGLLTYFAPTLTMVQNLVAPDRRGTAIAFYTLISSTIGAGFGPILLGRLSDAFAAANFGDGYSQLCRGGAARAGLSEAIGASCQSASAHGLQLAMLCCTLALAWGAIHYLLAARRLKQALYPAEGA